MKTNQYTNIINRHEVKPPIIKNMLRAFFFGGVICLLGQFFTWAYINWFNVSEKDAPAYMIVTMILIGTLLTAFGVYDSIANQAKAGTLIPITGFANSLTSSALEGRSEGFIMGILSSTLKVCGPVIVASVVSAFVFGLVRYMLVLWGIAPPLDAEAVSMIMGVFI